MFSYVPQNMHTERGRALYHEEYPKLALLSIALVNIFIGKPEMTCPSLMSSDLWCAKLDKSSLSYCFTEKIILEEKLHPSQLPSLFQNPQREAGSNNEYILRTSFSKLYSGQEKSGRSL